MTKTLLFTLLTIGALISLGEAQGAGDQDEESPFEYTKRVHEDLNNIKALAPENYFQKIDNYRTDLEKYIDHKKRVCEGEFSTVILNPTQSKNSKSLSDKRTKLSKEERKLCFRELKALQITFINNMYLARKKYLDYLHQKRIKELEDTRLEAVKSLRASFDKKSTRKARRRR
jgi:hypothetical protein